MVSGCRLSNRYSVVFCGISTEVTALSAAVRYDSLYADSRPRLTLAGSGCQLTWISVELWLVRVSSGVRKGTVERQINFKTLICRVSFSKKLKCCISLHSFISMRC